MARDISERELYRFDFDEEWEYKVELIKQIAGSAVDSILTSQSESNDKMADAISMIAKSQASMSSSIDRLAAAIESAAVSQAGAHVESATVQAKSTVEAGRAQAGGMIEAAERIAGAVNSAATAAGEHQAASSKVIGLFTI